jgi:hypothetical protein
MDRKFDNYPIENRALLLKDNCDEVEILDYNYNFSDDESAEKKDMLSDLMVRKNTIEIEKKEKVDEFNEMLKPINKDIKLVLEEIRFKSEKRHEECYKFLENGMANYYNSEGILVTSRPQKPSERQKTIHMELRKTGANQ